MIDNAREVWERRERNPSILFVANDAAFFISHRLPLAVGAREAGYDVAVACPPSDRTAAFEKLGLSHISVTPSRGANGPGALIRLFVDYLRLFGSLRPDVVHLITSKPIIVGGIAARLLGLRSVAAISGLGFLFSHEGFAVRQARRLAMFGYRFALDRRLSHTIFQNRDDLMLFQESRLIGRGVHTLIPGSGADLQSITYQPEPDTPVVVMLPARMLREKGVAEFVDAARLLRARGVIAVFRLQGRIDAENPTAITEGEIQGWVDRGWVEWRPHTDDIGAALAESHIVALPSYYREGLPKTLVDAAAAGRPTVTTDWPGCRDAIEPGVTGLLCRPRDSADLAEKIARLIENREERVRMGAAARRLAEERYDIRLVVAQHLRIYARLLETKGAN